MNLPPGFDDWRTGGSDPGISESWDYDDTPEFVPSYFCELDPAVSPDDTPRKAVKDDN